MDVRTVKKQLSLLSFLNRYGLLVYPEYLPDSPDRPVQFNNFTAWSSQGGAQVCLSCPSSVMLRFFPSISPPH